MSKNNKKNNKKYICIAIVLLLLILVIGICWIFLREDSTDGAGEVVAWDVTNEIDTAGETPGIRIPGYQTMIFKAGQTSQTVNMGNPADNTCYFVITLKLEDGTVLYRSDYLKPGQGFERIRMEKALQKGEYTGIIQYQCYSLEDKSVLNGASSEFELKVQ